MNGKIKRVFHDKNYGFITGVDGKEYFFHKDDNIMFDQLSEGKPVKFDSMPGTKGPRAKNIDLED